MKTCNCTEPSSTEPSVFQANSLSYASTEDTPVPKSLLKPSAGLAPASLLSFYYKEPRIRHSIPDIYSSTFYLSAYTLPYAKVLNFTAFKITKLPCFQWTISTTNALSSTGYSQGWNNKQNQYRLWDVKQNQPNKNPPKKETNKQKTLTSFQASTASQVLQYL